MDMGTIGAAVASIKAASDISKSLLQLKSIGDVQSKVIELQSQILSAQELVISAQAERTELLDKVRALKANISDLKSWEAEKARYVLSSPYRGVIVYALRLKYKAEEPAHWLCTQCFARGVKSILNSRERRDRSSFWIFACPECRFEFDSPYRSSSAMTYGEEPSSQAAV